MDSWIRQVRILDPLTQRDQVGDVLIRDGIIQIIQTIDEAPLGVAGDAAGDIPDVDGQGCILGPGLVDLYSQTGDPGHESRETLEQLLVAAAQGGFTRVGVLPNTTPAVDHPAQVAQRLAHNQPHSRPHSQPHSRPDSQTSRQTHPHGGQLDRPQVLPWGAITQGTQGEQLTDLMELGDTGIVGFCDGQPLTQGLMLQRLLQYTQPLSLPVALWPCDRTSTGADHSPIGTCREGADAIRLGLLPLPVTAETIALSALLEEVADSLRPVHLMRISTARSVELIRAAKSGGLPITASVTWLHLLFSTADLDSYAPSLRLAPPLGTPADQAALIAGLEDGTLDAIAVDHCAHTYEEKAVPFGIAPPGAVGLQLALPVLWQAFVTTQRWTPLQLWTYLSLQPAQCLGIEPAKVQPQATANLVLFDPQATWTATAERLGCDIINTPYGQQIIQGQAKHIWMADGAKHGRLRPED